MTMRAGIRFSALLAIAAGMAAAPGSARMAEPSPVGREMAGPGTGLICVWAIYASMVEVGERCGVSRNAAFEAELTRSISSMEDYSLRRSPEGARRLADYRAREIVGNSGLCTADATATYRQMSQTAPETIRSGTERLLADSPPVEWGTCL